MYIRFNYCQYGLIKWLITIAFGALLSLNTQCFAFQNLGIVVKDLSTNNALLVRRLDINWIKVDTFWGTIEKTKSNYSWKRLDKIITAARLNNLKTLLTLDYSNPIYLDGSYRGTYVEKSRYFPSSMIMPYRAFVTSLAARYGEHISAWEIWNEPNLDGFWKESFDRYVELLEYSTHILKANGHVQKILIGGLAQKNQIKWMNNLLKSCGDKFDVLSAHLYFYGGGNLHKRAYYERLLEILELKQKHNKEMWITETGIPTGGYGPNKKIQWGFSGYTQAEEIVRRILLSIYLKVDNMFIYELKERCCNGYKRKCNFGIIANNDLRKSSVPALMFLNSSNIVDVYMLDLNIFKVLYKGYKTRFYFFDEGIFKSSNFVQAKKGTNYDIYGSVLSEKVMLDRLKNGLLSSLAIELN